MIFFMATRGKGEIGWSKRGTVVARSSKLAERIFRKEFKVRAGTQVMACAGGYPNSGKVRFVIAASTHLVPRKERNLKAMPKGRPSQGLLLRTLAK